MSPTMMSTALFFLTGVSAVKLEPSGFLVEVSVSKPSDVA